MIRERALLGALGSRDHAFELISTIPAEALLGALDAETAESVTMSRDVPRATGVWMQNAARRAGSRDDVIREQIVHVIDDR